MLLKYKNRWVFKAILRPPIPIINTLHLHLGVYNSIQFSFIGKAPFTIKLFSRCFTESETEPEPTADRRGVP